MACTICNGASLALGREGAVDIGLAERVAKIAIGGRTQRRQRGAALGAGQRVREEIEILVDDGFGQIRRGRDESPASAGSFQCSSGCC